MKEQLLKAGLISEEQAQSASHKPNRRSPRRASPSPSASRPESEVAAIVRTSRVNVPVRGQRRWYFETQDGRLPYLAVSEPCAALLEQGQAAIVEMPNGSHKIVNEEGAQKLHTLAPATLRIWNRPAND